MVKIIEEKKRECTCSSCKSKLSYEKEDVKTKLLSRGPCDYGGDCAGVEENYVDYIICPVCGEQISIGYHTNYR